MGISDALHEVVSFLCITCGADNSFARGLDVGEKMCSGRDQALRIWIAEEHERSGICSIGRCRMHRHPQRHLAMANYIIEER